MGELFTILFGDYSIAQLIAFVIFFIIGYIVYGLIETSGRDKFSTKTPKKWNWKFWFNDNWRRYLTTILCSFILFRFYSELSGHPFGNFDALTFGLLGDGIAATVKKRIRGIGADREKLMETYVADGVESDNKIIADNIKEEQESIANELKENQKIIADNIKVNNKVKADDLKG